MSYSSNIEALRIQALEEEGDTPYDFGSRMFMAGFKAGQNPENSEALHSVVRAAKALLTWCHAEPHVTWNNLAGELTRSLEFLEALHRREGDNDKTGTTPGR